MNTLKLVEPTQMAFNYDALPFDVALEVKAAEQRIAVHMESLMEHAVAVGAELVSVKDRLPHGEFDTWVAATFPLSKRTAARWMKAAQYVGAKNAPGAYLNGVGLKLIEELTSSATPLEVREEVERMIEAGEVVTKATVAELRTKLSGLEKAKVLAEEEIEQKDAKVSELEDGINLAISEGIEKASKRIAKGFEDEIARLKREVADLKKPKPAPVIDNDTGAEIDGGDNVVSLHKPLTDDEAAAIDAEHDEYQDADFIETASDRDRAISVFGAIRNIAAVKASPKALYQHITSHSRATVDEYMAMVDQSLAFLTSVKELHHD